MVSSACFKFFEGNDYYSSEHIGKTFWITVIFFSFVTITCNKYSTILCLIRSVCKTRRLGEVIPLKAMRKIKSTQLYRIGSAKYRTLAVEMCSVFTKMQKYNSLFSIGSLDSNITKNQDVIKYLIKWKLRI